MLSFLGARLKAVGISALVTLVIGGAVGGWWHIKRVTEMKVEHREEVASLAAELEMREKAREELQELLKARNARINELRNKRREAAQRLEEVKNEDEESARYLASPVPDGVRNAVQEAACSILPDTCKLDGEDAASAREDGDERATD